MIDKATATPGTTLTPPKGFIFDYGGTIDTQGCHWGKMIWHACERLRMPFSEEAFKGAYVFAERTLGKNPIIQTSYSFRKTLKVKLRIEMEYLLANHVQMDAEEGERVVECLLDDLYARVAQTTEESRKVLCRLAEHVPLVLVSNFYGNMGVVLEEFGLEGLFSHVVESAVVGVCKPNPRIFQIGVEALGMTPADVVVVGDSFEKDILPATQIGCRTVWVKGEEWATEPRDESIPETVIDSLDELPVRYGLQ